MKIKKTFILFFLFAGFLSAQAPLLDAKQFENPGKSYRPHTRWWWPSTVTKEEITRELEQMKSHGIGGVEQITMGDYYQKGHVPFMSDEFIGLLKHMVFEAKRLDMEVSINFGGPGWIIGGSWVPENERSKDIVPSFFDINGPKKYSGPLSNDLIPTKRSWEIRDYKLKGNEKLLAVVAAKIIGDTLVSNSVRVITDRYKNGKLNWTVPAGNWRVASFWLKRNAPGNAVDHFSVKAMRRYCNYLGGKLYKAFGDEFGKTVESMFVDSFELPNSASGIYWNEELLDEFKKYKGYDLVPYLPAVWWQLGNLSPKIRYDMNDFLDYQGRKAFFETFSGWCKDHNVKARIQPYGFTTDILKSAGMTDIPEMEITAGEKDKHPWFDTRIGPKKYVASGAHIYGRPLISTEAYTFMHRERFLSTLEELKIASDMYLRNGATKFYNHGFSYSPERQAVPTRTVGFAAFLNPQNILWDYYPLLADYVARCSYVLRQGHFSPDIAVYSPLANQWTKDVLNARKWTREFDWGELGALLISNGYDFDLLNDDALQNLVKIENSKLALREMNYKILLMPNIESMPLQTLQFIELYVKAGGVVLALDRLPAYSTGLKNYRQKDKDIIKIIDEIFSPKYKEQTYFIKNVIHRPIWWDTYASYQDPFLKILRKHIQPDFGIDFAKLTLRKNEGLTFLHRKVGDDDVYFVANVQDKRSEISITFRVNNCSVEKWNPYNGRISNVLIYEETEKGIRVPLKLAPYESTIFVFRNAQSGNHIVRTDFEGAVNLKTLYTSKNGEHFVEQKIGNQVKRKYIDINGIPAPLNISGKWKLQLGDSQAKEMYNLFSWTDDVQMRHFSGTGVYDIDFRLDENFVNDNILLKLDLGKVGVVAKISINGKNAGTVWMCDQKTDITKLVKKGRNHLRVKVTNLLINRVSAMTEPLPVPKDMLKHFGGPLKVEHLPREFGYEALPASGLLGPVRIEALKKVEIE